MDLGFEQTNERLGRVEEDLRRLRGDLGREIRGVRGDLGGEIQDLRTEMTSGFEKVDARFAAMDAKFDARFDRLNRTIIYLLGGSLSILTGGLLAGFIHALF
jgi:hypothetical protein